MSEKQLREKFGKLLDEVVARNPAGVTAEWLDATWFGYQAGYLAGREAERSEQQTRLVKLSFLLTGNDAALSHPGADVQEIMDAHDEIVAEAERERARHFRV